MAEFRSLKFSQPALPLQTFTKSTKLMLKFSLLLLKMSNVDMPALNSDGTFKDASEIAWIHSLSAQQLPADINPTKKHFTNSIYGSVVRTGS